MTQKRGNRRMPSNGVYTRIKPSKIHGVGVFAIRAIPKGASIFPDDDAPIVWVKRSKIKRLRGEIRRLYEDFCIIKDNGETYGCPANFSLMTTAWFLNEPKRGRHPNVGCRKDYTFYALRDIAAGEELTVDYSTFSEKPSCGIRR
ncbi:MAG: SET domain-containing protein-lysine N-methyltransferase [Limisphaerales bacterium]